jgi:hypothetical protein
MRPIQLAFFILNITAYKTLKWHVYSKQLLWLGVCYVFSLISTRRLIISARAEKKRKPPNPFLRSKSRIRSIPSAKQYCQLWSSVGKLISMSTRLRIVTFQTNHKMNLHHCLNVRSYIVNSSVLEKHCSSRK